VLWFAVLRVALVRKLILPILLAVLCVGCGAKDVAELHREVQRLKKEKAEAERLRENAETRLAAYKMDLEHQRFLVNKLKQEIAELKKRVEEQEQTEKLKELVAKIEAVQLQPPAQRPASPVVVKPTPAPKPVAVTPPRPKPAVALAPKPKPRPAVVAKPKPVKHPPRPEPVRAKPSSPKESKSPAAKKRERPAAPPSKTHEKPKPKVAKSKPAEKPKPAARESRPVAEEPKTPPPQPPSIQLQPRYVTRAPSQPMSSGKGDLQLVGVRDSIEKSVLCISGQVVNNTSGPIVNVSVIASLYGSDGQILKTVRTKVNAGNVLAGKSKSSFELRVPWSSEMRGYKLKVMGTQKNVGASKDE